ncbi:hypothetical protein KPL71_014007 [Citrus sinensis]|uniref:Uncharacterized protein n=1 Tax=Citrus sinensis TaxID=2711 RepID=A0ACB8K8R4_CITSI|nr:hypothetical protein KPL71_014007 [Citrus sinensis]
MVFGQVVIGPPGSGKTTYCNGMSQFLSLVGRNECAVNIEDLIRLSDVMMEYSLGPNGGLMYCMDYLEKNIDWLQSKLEPLLKDHYLLFDFPGQVELFFLHSNAKTVIMRLIKKLNLRLTAVHLVDVHLCSDPGNLSPLVFTMVDAIVSSLVEQLTSFAAKEIIQQVKLVVGVEEEVKSLTSHLQAIQAVLDDAEEKQVKDKAVRLWLGRLKYASYDIEDVLDEWITARHKLQIEGGADDNALAAPQKKKKIKEINEELHDIATQKDMFNLVKSGNKSGERPRRVQSTSLIDEEEICGRVGEKNELISKLLYESSEQQKGLHIISIVGMGGIGKTTLAQLACNHDEVKRKFDKILWVCVSETFEEFRVAKAIVEALDGRESHLGEFQSLLKHIYESIAGKSFLLVLDDVWDGNYLKWEPFYRCLKNGLHGSKILVTTRKGSVASMMGSTDIISVKELAEEECWLLFNKIAFFDRSIEEREKLEQIGQRIAGKCKGLPLAAKTIGSLMHSKQTEEEWKRILNSDLWKVEEIEKDVLSSLLLSYNDLPSRVKRCFSYCVVFPKDYDIKKDELITLWMAQGYLSAEQNEEMETVGEEYFGILASRSFFQEFRKSYDNRIIACKMHDMVHDFARFVSQNECFSMAINGSEEPNATNSLAEKVRHLMLISSKGASLPVSTLRVKRMRTLLINDSRSDHSLLNGIGRLTGLRTLDEFHVSGGGGVDGRKACRLESLKNLEHLQLPPLGKLPSLEKLRLLDMKSVKRLGDEFLGIESDHHGTSSSSSVIIAFPKLKSLSIEFLFELEEWDYGITRTGNTFINIMPRLSSLTIILCPKLKALPDHIHQTTTLKELISLNCDLLEERYRKGEGEDWPKISHIPNLHIGL